MYIDSNPFHYLSQALVVAHRVDHRFVHDVVVGCRC